jgi:5-methyltetrahydropteroyltriglutamate--homocysteine methyltransferase
MPIPTEPIGSIPRPPELISAIQESASDGAELEALYADAVRDTIARFEATGSPVITDGEQRKPSFATYPIDGLELAPDGVVIPFADGHTRQLPRLTRGPFRYQTYADGYLAAARDIATRPVKQAVISASALSLLYPEDGIDGDPRDAFLADLLGEVETDIRRSLARRRPLRPDRLHRGAALAETRPVRWAAAQLRRAEQRRPPTLLGRRAQPTWSPHLPGWR